MQNNAKQNCSFTEKPGGHIVIGSKSPTFERPMGGQKISFLHGSSSTINQYDSKKPHEKCGAFVCQATIILLAALTIPRYCQVFCRAVS